MKGLRGLSSAHPGALLCLWHAGNSKEFLLVWRQSCFYAPFLGGSHSLPCIAVGARRGLLNFCLVCHAYGHTSWEILPIPNYLEWVGYRSETSIRKKIPATWEGEKDNSNKDNSVQGALGWPLLCNLPTTKLIVCLPHQQSLLETPISSV